MRLKILFSGKTYEEEGESLPDILGRLDTNIESVIVFKENKVVLEEEIFDGDTIELVNVVSGG